MDKRQGIVRIIGPARASLFPELQCAETATRRLMVPLGPLPSLSGRVKSSVSWPHRLITKRSKNMRIQVDGALPTGVSSKDIILHTIGVIGTAGGTGAVINIAVPPSEA